MLIFIIFTFRGEFFLNDWILKQGNYNRDYINSIFSIEGYYDDYAYELVTNSDDKDAIINHRRRGISKIGSKFIYEFIMIPSAGFLKENKPLPPNVELKLSFDRLPAEFSTILLDSDGIDPLKGQVLELKDVYAQVEYISSPFLRNFFDRIEVNPISYTYDECNIIYKSLPTEEQSIRLDNLKGGNTPDYIFMAIISTSMPRIFFFLFLPLFRCTNRKYEK